MKPWMKILMWFGLGSVVGYFAGQQIGYNKAKKEDEAVVNDAYIHGQKDMRDSLNEDFVNRMREEYNWTPMSEDVPMDEDAEMPMEEPVIPYAFDELDADDIQDIPDGVPVFHPSFSAPVIVTEDGYEEAGNQDPPLDEEVLIYYEGDEVLYNTSTQSIIEDGDIPGSIGVGTLYEFRVGGEPPKDVIYVVNETYGTRFKIYRSDEAFAAAVDGNCAPDEDDEEE